MNRSPAVGRKAFALPAAGHFFAKFGGSIHFAQCAAAIRALEIFPNFIKRAGRA